MTEKKTSDRRAHRSLVLVKATPVRSCLRFIRRNCRRGARFVTALIFVLSSITAVFSPLAQTAAASTASEMSLTDRALSWATYNGLRKCISDNAKQQVDTESIWGVAAWAYWPYVKEDSATSNTWWSDDARQSGSYLAGGAQTSDRGGDGKASCNDILSTGLSLWGYSNSLDLLCDAGVTRADGSPCREGSDRFGSLADWEDEIAAAIRAKAYDGDNPSVDYAGGYELYLAAFQSGCEAVPSSSTADSKYVYENIQVIDADGDLTPTRYVGGRDSGTSRLIYISDSLGEYTMTCGDLASILSNPDSDIVKGRVAYQLAHQDEPVTDPAKPHCTNNPDAEGCTTESTTTSCVIDGVGWIVCSAAVFLANVTDSVYGLVSNILEVPPINIDVDDGTNGAYNAWNIMRSIANVVFVIAFLVIIYSQLTSTGVSNYGVKKLLPRLMVVAVLVNVSYWIGAIAVDVSNIIGHGIYDIFASVKNRMNIGISENWGNIIVGLLAGQALAVQGGTLVIGSAAVLGFAAWAAGSSGILAVVLTVLPMLLLAVLAVFVVAFLLIARQAIVIILIMISPLAFVAMLFPNTEKYYKKWLELLMTMLTMFPLVSFVFGGAQVAGLAILSTAEGATDPVAAGLAIIVGQLVMVLPFFFLFTLIGKFSGSQLGALAGKLRASGMKAINGVRKYSDPLADRKRKLAMSRLQSGQITRRYNRRGQETTLSKLSGSAGGLVGGVLNTFGASKHADEVHTKANEMDVQRGYANTAAGQAADAALRTATLQDAIDEKARETHFEATAPLDLKLKAKLADEQLKVEKAQTNQVAVEAATLMAQAANESDPVKRAQLEYRASLRAGGDLSIAHDLHAAHTDAALASEATNVAGRLQQQEHAKQIQTDPALLSRATGIGGAAAQSRVLASTQHTLQKAVADDVEAERSSVANMTDVTALKAEFNARDASGAHIASAARRAALAERAITIGDPADYHDIVDSVGATTGSDAETNVMRQTVARAVAADSQLFKAGDIDAIATGTLATRTGAPNTVALTVRDNVEKGVLSAEKTVGASNGDLKFAHANASPRGRQMLRDAALEVKGNDTLRGKIKHNATAIENLSRGLAP